MNRQELLTCIERHLRAHLAETGEERPLGEIVPRIASEVQTLAPETMRANGNDPHDVVPVWQIAAFVDGGLENDEVLTVCRAAQFDNSVLAELAGSVREQLNEAPKLSNSLESRLLAMHPGPLENVATNRRAESAEESLETIDGQITTDLVRSNQSSNEKSREVRRVFGVSVLAAAVILLALFAGSRWLRSGDREKDIVDREHKAETDGRPRTNGNRPETRQVPPRDDNEVNGDGNDENGEPEEKSPSPKTGSTRPIRVVQDDTNDGSPNVPKNSGSPGMARSGDSPFSKVAWREIAGVLATSVTSTSKPTGPTVWVSVEEGKRLGRDPERLRLRTMPFSRAEGSFDERSSIVLATDTRLDIESAGQDPVDALTLLHGGVALLNWPAGSRIELRRDEDSVTLVWEDEADVVLEHAVGGLRMDVVGGTVLIDDQKVRNQSMIFAKQQPPQTVERAKRHPNWVREIASRSTLPKDVLEDLGRASNVSHTLTQLFNALANQRDLSVKQQRTLEELAQWRAALAGKNLYRMAGSRNATLRVAAMQRLVDMPTWDPRYGDAWQGIDRAMNDRQRNTRLRRWCEMIRGGGKPTPTQIEQLLNGLQADQVVTRAMSDYLLRRLLGGGPPFDPTWTGATLNRGVNAWRKAAGRPRPQAISGS